MKVSLSSEIRNEVGDERPFIGSRSSSLGSRRSLGIVSEREGGGATCDNTLTNAVRRRGRAHLSAGCEVLQSLSVAWNRELLEGHYRVDVISNSCITTM